MKLEKQRQMVPWDVGTCLTHLGGRSWNGPGFGQSLALRL